jgi:hypothetical protein
MSEILAQGAQFSQAAIQRFLSLLIYDPGVDTHIIRPAHFVDPIYAEIVECVLAYRNTYGQCPSPQALEAALEAHFQPEDPQTEYPVEILAAALSVVQGLPPVANDSSLDYFRAQFIQFARTQRVNQALQSAEGFLSRGEHAEFARLVMEAATSGSEQQVQTLDLWDFSAWCGQAQNRRQNALMLGFPTLDYYVGGLLGGELLTVVAPPSGGKTRFLMSIAQSCMRQGKDALVISLEEEAWKLCMRLAMRILGKSQDEILANPETYQSQFSAMRQGGSTIRFARFTPGISTVYDLQAYYRNTYLPQYGAPGIIVVDYADKLGAASRREHYRLELHDIYLSLFSWAMDLGIPVATASQTSKEGFDRKLLTMRDAGETIAKAAISDVILTLNNSPDNPGTTRVFIAKRRGAVDNHGATLVIDPVTQDLVEAEGAFR